VPWTVGCGSATSCAPGLPWTADGGRTRPNRSFVHRTKVSVTFEIRASSVSTTVG